MSSFREFVCCPRKTMTEALRRLSILGLKEKQQEAIEAFVSRKDTFVSLPTGYGKSVIYVILPVMFDILLGESCPDSVGYLLVYRIG